MGLLPESCDYGDSCPEQLEADHLTDLLSFFDVL